MTRNEIRNYRAQRDHRFNVRWWALFFVGCLGAFISTAVADGFTSIPWLILGGLSGMIIGRRHHTKRIARADVMVDAQAQLDDEAEAALVQELEHMAHKAQANRAAESKARDGKERPD